jgi:hypothetical protein
MDADERNFMDDVIEKTDALTAEGVHLATNNPNDHLVVSGMVEGSSKKSSKLLSLE